MNLSEWFTEENFEKWWEGKQDLPRSDSNYRGPRMYTCPLARFARGHGLYKASVRGNWLLAADLATPLLLPQWAREAVEKFDLLYYGEPYSE